MSREEALKSFTIWGSYAAFQEKFKGTIEKNKYADIVVLSDNILKVPEEKILDIKIIKTFVNGKITFEKR